MYVFYCIINRKREKACFTSQKRYFLHIFYRKYLVSRSQNNLKRQRMQESKKISFDTVYKYPQTIGVIWSVKKRTEEKKKKENNMIPVKQQLTIRHFLTHSIRDSALQSELHRGSSTTLKYGRWLVSLWRHPASTQNLLSIKTLRMNISNIVAGRSQNSLVFLGYCCFVLSV